MRNKVSLTATKDLFNEIQEAFKVSLGHIADFTAKHNFTQQFADLNQPSSKSGSSVKSYSLHLQINGIVPVGVSAIYADHRRIGIVALPWFDLVLFG